LGQARVQAVRQTGGVLAGLELDAGQGVPQGLGLDHADGLAVHEEQVVRKAVALLQLELPDGDAMSRRRG
jgi:serine acetyltransferase